MTDLTCAAEQAIDTGPVSGRQKQIFLLCCMLAMADGFDLQVMALVLPDLSDSWGVGKAVFAWALSAGLVGGMLGGFLMGLVGGIVAPTRVIIAATLAFSVFTGLAALSQSVMQLAILRFLAGIGLGATIPAVIAIVSTYVPRHMRSIAVTVTSASQMLGGVVGGMLIAPIVPRLGWQFAFVLGGILPLILLVFVAARLPDPPNWILRRADGPGRLAQLIGEMGKRLSEDCGAVATRGEALPSASIARLLRPRFALGTLALWVTCVSGAIFFYMMVNWLPTFLRAGGAGASMAITGSVMLNAGGFCGAIALSRFMDMGWPYLVIIGGFVIATMLAATTALTLGHSPILNLVTIFAIGVFGIGSYFCITSLHVHYFPAPLVGTAIGCAVGFSRAGAIAAPFVGAMVLGAGGGTDQMFMAVAALAALNAVAILTVAWKARRTNVTSRVRY